MAPARERATERDARESESEAHASAKGSCVSVYTGHARGKDSGPVGQTPPLREARASRRRGVRVTDSVSDQSDHSVWDTGDCE